MKKIFILLLVSFTLQLSFSQDNKITALSLKEKPEYKFSVLTTWLTFSNFGNPETNTHHYEIRFAYNFTLRDQIGVKLTTWKLFAPLGIDIWDDDFLNREFFFPGKLRETGFGITYQRKLWKGLFATLEVMPQYTTYINRNGQKIGNGFKLYNSYHLGYHFPLFKKGKFYIEPQIHVNHWPINYNVPSEFSALEDMWDNVFLIEPNIYIGINF